jgi:phage shock protein C
MLDKPIFFTNFVFNYTNKMLKTGKFRYLVENQLFGVCSRLGEKMNFSAGSVRIYFIYASFFTFGSPIIIYLVLAFWLEVRKHLRRHQNPTVWEF